MKALSTLLVGAGVQLASGVASAQHGNMMSGGWWGMDWTGAYMGLLEPLVLVAVLVGVGILLIQRKGK